VDRAEAILVGGVLANTLLKSRGVAVGKSLMDDSFVPSSAFDSPRVLIPTDVRVSKSLSRAENVARRTRG
jgi:3-phosphoglycerate kinase